jgi:hypothetical protein
MFETDNLTDGWMQAGVEIQNHETERTYTLHTNIELRGSSNKQVTFHEHEDQSVVRTGHNLFDALFALAHHEVRENSVASIRDGAFNHNVPIEAPVFETGQEWHYVWTRDLSYAVQLALAGVDPIRAKNSLLFKLSYLKSQNRIYAVKDGVLNLAKAANDNLQIVQDTGTGGSYPVSTDRVVWALAAAELLKYLDGQERSEFLTIAYEALTNTIEHDRNTIFDPDDHLYYGEQSFLDWRKQSYPEWAETEPLSIGRSKALSTNILHYKLLDLASQLAAGQGLNAARKKYHSWAADLKSRINQAFYIQETGLFSTMIFGDRCPVKMDAYDLLGESLAIIFGIANSRQAAAVVAKYPHTPVGAPVIFPQKREVAAYHNKAIWPFATVYWIKAAAKAKNPAAVDQGLNFLMKSVAFNLSNMENFHFLTGANSQTPLNSRRQLWSVAGYLAMVQDIIFGLDVGMEGIRFLPFITSFMRTLFTGDQITLNRFTYKGKKINVIVKLPSYSATQSGYYPVAKIWLNGSQIDSEYLSYAVLKKQNTIEIELGKVKKASSHLNLITDPDSNSPLYCAPKEPAITVPSPVDGLLRLEFSPNGESGVTFNIYRDGQLQTAGCQDTWWTDPDSADYPNHTYFYAVQAVNQNGNVSFPSPTVYYDQNYQNTQIIEAKNFQIIGGQRTFNYNMEHYQYWGDREHRLTTPDFTPSRDGIYQVFLWYGNGSGPVNTGITCAVKKVAVTETDSEKIITEAVVVMPQLAQWHRWHDSSYFEVRLESSKAYRISVFEDQSSLNMSFFRHFSMYTGNNGVGGGDAPYNFVNIAQVKLLYIKA